MMKQLAFAAGCLLSLSAFAGGNGTGTQDTINHVDGNGKKQGYWIVTGRMKAKATFTPEQKVEEGTYKTSRKIGLWRKYFPNQDNSVRTEINYQSGRPYGDYVVYYDNGQVEERGFWHKNRQIGSFERNYSDGTAQQRFNFDDTGLRSGTQLYYYPNGQLAASVEVKEGKKNGEMVRYWPDGQVKERMQFNDGALDPSTVEEFKATKVFAEVEIEIIDKPEEIAPAVEKSREAVNVGALKCDGRNKLFNKAGQITQDGYFKKCRMYEGKVYNYKNGLLVDIDVYHKGYFVGKGVAEADDKAE